MFATPFEDSGRATQLSWPVTRSSHGLNSSFLKALKEPVARKAIAYLKSNASRWLARITVQEGQLVGIVSGNQAGGYDRNVTDLVTLRFMIDYMHANPVRRGLVPQSEEWEWSSARWYAGIRPVKIEMDDSVLEHLELD